MNRGLLNPILVKNHMVSGFTLLVVIATGVQVSLAAEGVYEIAEKTTVKINIFDNQEGREADGGSGVIINKSGRIYTVLTANHVVCDLDEIALARKKVACETGFKYTIQTNTGKEYPIKDRQVLQKAPSDPDLATVTFESGENYAVAVLGNSGQVKLGTDVTVAGFPAIFGNKGKNRTFTITPGKLVTLIPKGQMGYSLVYSADTYIGNSGGPVFDGSGRVIGIHGLAHTDQDSGESETRGRKRPRIREIIGQRETGASSGGKTGFNAGIPINTFFSLTGQQPPTSAVQPVLPPPPPVAPGDSPRRPTRYKAPSGPAVCPGTVC
ncbi:trypsin-like peptidase domain-containing protein [Cylindrospermopsis raciborskii Cr2010]|uniref:S1 family peptidase n=1 Tax=Cylindrospermopsis raciborskii TaxID=77022 RepID=UPI000E1ED65F|nr:serine protease [Cylindrospermopsis raciborskii]UJL33219.1 trypsin-like peptidase domain-containing protein [Cylindrospermopsis raciborskii Cr2010]